MLFKLMNSKKKKTNNLSTMLFKSVHLIDMTTKTSNSTPSDPSADRLLYACFPAALKDAMKVAARRYEWDRETWRYQTGLIQETLLSGRFDANSLAVAYRNPPNSNAEGSSGDFQGGSATHA